MFRYGLKVPTIKEALEDAEALWAMEKFGKDSKHEGMITKEQANKEFLKKYGIALFPYKRRRVMKKALMILALAAICQPATAQDYRFMENSTASAVSGFAIGYAATAITQRFFDMAGQDTKERRITAICVGILAGSLYSAQDKGLNTNKLGGSLLGTSAGIVLNWSFRF